MIRCHVSIDLHFKVDHDPDVVFADIRHAIQHLHLGEVTASFMEETSTTYEFDNLSL